MKKIVLLLMLVIGVWSCSTDNDEGLLQNESDAFQWANEENAKEGLITPSCFTSLSGQVRVDLSGGLGNPVVVFTPVITGSVPSTASFRVRVEVQPLSDCDNMNSNTGTILTFSTSGTVQNVIASPPAISVLPGNMPLCYKWRFVFEGISSSQRNPTCYSESVWYESPLF